MPDVSEALFQNRQAVAGSMMNSTAVMYSRPEAWRGQMKTVTICPAFDALYYSFYIQGIVDSFGKANVEFSYKGFPRLPLDCLAFIVHGTEPLRVVIDAYDGVRLTNHRAIEWCDVYGKVNLEWSALPHKYAYKCLPIGPSFPVRLWSWSKSICMGLRNYHPRVQGVKYARKHFSDYVRQCRDRLPLTEFVPGHVRNNYVFFSATIWREAEAPGTNQCRSSFMTSCKSFRGLKFEGGFSPPRSLESSSSYSQHIAPKRYPLSEWLEKIKWSVIAFNTPAVWASHTWKLAEYLALGKAIVSMPIQRELPVPLVHGRNIHYVDGSLDGFADAIRMIVNNRDYRMQLEQNARSYYLTYLSPGKVIERLLNHFTSTLAKSAPRIVQGT